MHIHVYKYSSILQYQDKFAIVLQNEALLSILYVHCGKVKLVYRARGKTVLSRASAHSPISPLLWFFGGPPCNRPLCYIFFSSDFVGRKAKLLVAKMVRASENFFVNKTSGGRVGVHVCEHAPSENLGIFAPYGVPFVSKLRFLVMRDLYPRPLLNFDPFLLNIDRSLLEMAIHRPLLNIDRSLLNIDLC